VAQASAGDHTTLATACRALEEAQKEVEKLYARWQELEAKRAGW
jgi:ATP-binding cassette subfamily F protein uup